MTVKSIQCMLQHDGYKSFLSIRSTVPACTVASSSLGIHTLCFQVHFQEAVPLSESCFKVTMVTPPLRGHVLINRSSTAHQSTVCSFVAKVQEGCGSNFTPGETVHIRDLITVYAQTVEKRVHFDTRTIACRSPTNSKSPNNSTSGIQTMT